MDEGDGLSSYLGSYVDATVMRTMRGTKLYAKHIRCIDPVMRDPNLR